METKIASLSRGDTVAVSTDQEEMDDLIVYREEKNDSTVRIKNKKYAYKIRYRAETDEWILINETKGHRLGLIHDIKIHESTSISNQ